MSQSDSGQKRKAFTLIELLIVVAIIAILAAIAVPNFLEAQVRAKVSRVKADMRTAATAIEAYAVDHGAYVVATIGNELNRNGLDYYPLLSTPVAYITSTLLKDPFAPPGGSHQYKVAGQPLNSRRYIILVNIDHRRRVDRPNRDYSLANSAPWVLISHGPNKRRGPRADNGNQIFFSAYAGNPIVTGDKYFVTNQYDPTNGTVSGGDILRWP